MPNGNAAVNQNAVQPRLHCYGWPAILSEPGNLPQGPTSRDTRWTVASNNVQRRRSGPTLLLDSFEFMTT